MDNFFTLHREKRIGYKALTDADLGHRETSHQTHMGLFDDILSFLPNNILVTDDAMFVYKNSASLIPLYFRRIENPDGSFRSPNIKSGQGNVITIVKTIKSIVNNISENLTWYLFWFGLENQQAVFWLFNNQSKEYKDITNMGLELNSNSKGRIKETDTIFDNLLSYIEQTIDIKSQNIIKELEIEAQSTISQYLDNKVKRFNIQKVQKRLAEKGYLGEIFINDYFDKLKHSNQIKHFNWQNKNGESGDPFDFSYQDLADNVIYLDVKSTSYEFENKIFFSDNEVSFAANQQKNCYNIYRVYELTDSKANLKICKNCDVHFNKINSSINNLKNNLQTISVQSEIVNISFLPCNENLSFESEIQLIKK